jgi:hypothetical protein
VDVFYKISKLILKFFSKNKTSVNNQYKTPQLDIGDNDKESKNFNKDIFIDISQE